MSDALAGLDFELSNEVADQITADYVVDLADALAQARLVGAIADNSALGQLQAQWLAELDAQGVATLEELCNG
jgi:hypothetical protein